jgi:hypothetical protein
MKTASKMEQSVLNQQFPFNSFSKNQKAVIADLSALQFNNEPLN